MPSRATASRRPIGRPLRHVIAAGVLLAMPLAAFGPMAGAAVPAAAVDAQDLDLCSFPGYCITGVLGQPISGTMADGGFGGNYEGGTWEITEGTLPAGVTMSTAGVFSGTPTESGSFTVTVVGNGPGWGYYGGKMIVVHVAPTAWTDETVAASLTVGVAFEDGVAANGYPAPTYAVSAGALPDGLALDTTTGAITGTPTTAGDFSFTITATNVEGSISSSFTGTVNGAPEAPDTVAANLGEATVGEPYMGWIEANGEPLPTFAVTEGELPPGLSLDSELGEVTGTPTTAGSFTFTITATNATGTATESFTITVAPGGYAPELDIDGDLDQGTVGSAYTDAVDADGDPEPTYDVTEGALPDGLSLDATTGVITGTPTTAGTFSFEVTATNEIGSDAETFSITIAAAPTGAIDLQLDLEVGADLTGGSSSFLVQGSGLQPGSAYSVTLRSTPRVLASGTVGGDGSFSQQVTMPADIEAGSHSLTVAGTGANGQPVEDVAWLRVDASGKVEATSTTGPIPDPPASGTGDGAPTPTPAPAPTASTPVPSQLPRTGADDRGAAFGIGGLLLQVGAAFVGWSAWARRRRMIAD